MVQRALEQLKAAWANIYELDFAVTKNESNPQLMQIRSPNEAVVVARFEAKVGKSSGLLNLCFPFVVIEPIISGFTAQTWLSQPKRHEPKSFSEPIRDNISKATLELVCHLCESGIRLSDLMDLQEGHIIQTDRPANSEVSLSIKGKLKFKGRPGMHKNHKAVHLSRRTQPNETI
jgi:flagellar motor switch protein FliM